MLALVLVVTCFISLECTPARTWADDVAASENREGSAVDAQAGFGLEGFTRYNAGAQRLVDDVDLGYRFPVADGSTVVIVNTPESVWVHVDEAAAEAAGFRADDVEDVMSRRSSP